MFASLTAVILTSLEYGLMVLLATFPLFNVRLYVTERFFAISTWTILSASLLATFAGKASNLLKANPPATLDRGISTA